MPALHWAGLSNGPPAEAEVKAPGPMKYFLLFLLSISSAQADLLEDVGNILGVTVYRTGSHYVFQIERPLSYCFALDSNNYQKLGEGIIYTPKELLGKMRALTEDEKKLCALAVPAVYVSVLSGSINRPLYDFNGKQIGRVAFGALCEPTPIDVLWASTKRYWATNKDGLRGLAVCSSQGQ